jgi:hypothetical protein
MMIAQRRPLTMRLTRALPLLVMSALSGCLQPDCAPETIVISAGVDGGADDAGPDRCIAICDAAPERPFNKSASRCEMVEDGISCTYTQFCEG